MRPFLVLLLVGAAFGSGPVYQWEDRSSDAQNVVEVTATGLNLEAPEEIPSGWTTFRFNNESAMIHFALVARYPGDKGVKEHQDMVAPIFQEGMDLLNEGEVDPALAVFGRLPDWFGEIVFTGGPGLVAPGGIAQTTVYLEPGTYVLECYVKTNGVFHSYNPAPGAYGMVHELTVTDIAHGAPAPQADIQLTLSSEHGIEVEGDLRPGRQTVEVYFADQMPHEHFLGHDVHLVRLEESTDVQALTTWMDWTQPTGLEAPAPAVFLGGLHEMPSGVTGYFTVTLTPGRYAWIAEVPNPVEKGMLELFTVSAERNVQGG